MTPERVAEIYQALTSVDVPLHSDPRTQSATYICEKIAQVQASLESCNSLNVEVKKELAARKVLKIQLKTMWEEAVRHFAVNMPTADRVGLTQRLLWAKAELQANTYLTQNIASNEGKTVAELEQAQDTFEQRMLKTENELVELSLLDKAIQTKIETLGKKDSAIRLQNAAIGLELKALGLSRGPGRPPKKKPTHSSEDISPAVFSALDTGNFRE